MVQLFIFYIGLCRWSFLSKNHRCLTHDVVRGNARAWNRGASRPVVFASRVVLYFMFPFEEKKIYG